MKKLFVLLFNLILISVLCSISVFAEETEQVLYNAPNEIKGVIVTPGDEFADEAGQSNGLFLIKRLLLWIKMDDLKQKKVELYILWQNLIRKKLNRK